jgi:biotin/methionine sulfoxide reductase
VATVPATVCELTTSHWGAYAVARDASGRPRLEPLREDPDPSPIGLCMLDAYRADVRVRRPAVRRSWLERGPGAATELRGREPFVEVSWDRALDLVAGDLERVRSRHANDAIFGGSYGWSSAGRFHHAQSQVHRFLNSAGGYVRHVDSYSLGAARVLMPHIVAPMEELMLQHHAWSVLQQHTRLVVCFGGIPAKNAQVTPGGSSEHRVRPALAELARAGCRFVNFSPVRSDLDVPAAAVEWIPIRPNTDAAVMLALATTIVRAGLHDERFLARHCVGFERVRDYLLGATDGIVKDARWAESIARVPAERIETLARELVGTRSLVNVAWSLQRSDHGEQPYWAAVLLAAVAGQIGLPGGGFGVAYGSVNLMGSPHARLPGPTLPQGRNAVDAFIPVARIADMLLAPGGSFDYNGQSRRYPDIRFVYWAGGNPFHHHQDLNRLLLAWRKPETIVVHEQVWNAHARFADIVLPATSTLERCDIGFSNRDPLMIAMKPVIPAPGEARDDYDIFAALARRLGCAETFTEGRDAMGWLRHLYSEAAGRMAEKGVTVPAFEHFWEAGCVRLPDQPDPPVMLSAYRTDPDAHPLATPSGRIELYSERIAGFGYDDCPGHAAWLEPSEWLGSPLAARHPLHLISDQPYNKLHSQLDFSAYSRGAKIAGREPIWISPGDARERGIGDGELVRVFNDRGACLAGAVVTDAMMRGVVKLSTGAWYDPAEPGVPGSLEKHGNPNVLTRDVGASRLSQGCAAQTCLVQVERFEGPPPAVTAFAPPVLVPGAT